MAARLSPSPSPSPVAASSSIAFVRDGDIWGVGSDGSGARLLVRAGDGAAPRWSGDGARLLFARGAGAGAEVYVAPGEGGEPRRLTSNARPESGAVWSPRAARVAYSVPRSLGPGGRVDPREPEEVWVVDLGAGAERKVADGFDPAWSPDGARLVYSTNGRRRAEGPSGPFQNAIHVVDVGGANDREVLAVDQLPRDLEPDHGVPFRPGTFRLRAPSWSPDGRMLVASADGHTAMAVTFDDRGRGLRVWGLAYEGGVGQAVWSPRGDRLAVEVRPATGVDVVLLVDLADRREQRIGGVQDGFQAKGPTWAPDGQRLAVITGGLPGGPSRPDPPRELRIYTADGQQERTVASGQVEGAAWNPARP